MTIRSMGLWGSLVYPFWFGTKKAKNQMTPVRNLKKRKSGQPHLRKMAKTKIDKLKSAKRFGARYGATLKHKFAKIEQVQRALHKCPYCSFKKAKRISKGIWECKKCNAKFTAKAYTIGKAIKLENVKPVEEEGTEK